jgi:hypothetical protein
MQVLACCWHHSQFGTLTVAIVLDPAQSAFDGSAGFVSAVRETLDLADDKDDTPMNKVHMPLNVYIEEQM